MDTGYRSEKNEKRMMLDVQNNVHFIAIAVDVNCLSTPQQKQFNRTKMKLQRKLTNKEWDEIVKEGPGVRNYRGQKTLFYNGEILWDADAQDYLIHDEEERDSWQVIIILPGVEIISERTFYYCCENVRVVIMADTVKRIEDNAFDCCKSLEFVKLSRNLEYIGECAFYRCLALTSIFIPPSCREIGTSAFGYCYKLIILNTPRTTELGGNLIARTALFDVYFQMNNMGRYNYYQEVNAWIKDINGNDEEYALHRACSAFNPISDIIYEIVRRKGLVSFQKKNEIGVMRYLEENPYANIDQQKLVKRYILEMMGEAI